MFSLTTAFPHDEASRAWLFATYHTTHFTTYHSTLDC